ncbi:hypothetical protein SDC9_59548 [bioreactor metagenome]|uniref:Glycosyltransferase RgtA/B/C/D-like domain-containing protein n=1 Tax=bioreactor metagenome TaxID=1076179 RepID=A0A644XGA7_9ZZZZ
MRVTPAVKIIVLSIVIAAAALRLFNLFHIPFTYDELSALLRTRYDSFGDLIRYGVMVDGHPAGIQVFLFYLVKISGYGEGWIKMPFILSGIASVYLIWKIGREWFSPNVGLLSAATVAFMQYFIVYSQIARPYSSGLFFTLLMLLGWSRLVLTGTKKVRRNQIIFILGGVLCAYNHHFSFLMVVLAGITGVFMVRGKELMRYLLSCLIIVLLYIPEIPVTLHQLSLGGVEQWLNKPTPHFFIDYGKYIFHFSKIAAATFILIVLFGIISAIVRRNFRIRKIQIIALIFGLIPVAAGYLYSIYFSALLQFSVLIFSFPMLILVSFSFFEKANLRHTIGLTILWSIVLIHSLIWNRDYYKYFYHSPYEESTKQIKAFTQTHPSDSTLVVCTYRSKIADIYKNKYDINPDIQYVFPDSLANTVELRKWLTDTTYHYLILAKTIENKPWLQAYCHEFFPITIRETNYNQGSCVIMKRGEPHYRNYLAGSKCDFSKASAVQWMFDPSKLIRDTLNSSCVLKIDSSVEYAATWMKNTSGFVRSKANVIDATAWVYLPDSTQNEALWVVSIESDTGTVCWMATPVNTETVPVKQWAPVSVSIFLPDLTAAIPSDAVIKVYLYNKNRSEFYMRQAFAGIRAGNPAVYWITYDLYK